VGVEDDVSLVAKRLFGSSESYGLPDSFEDDFRVSLTADNFLQILDTEDEPDSGSDGHNASYDEDDPEEDDMAEQAYENDEIEEEPEEDYEEIGDEDEGGVDSDDDITGADSDLEDADDTAVESK
jgi:hypothetical protein